MNFFTYLKSLLPIIGKDTILENLRVIRGSYSTAATTLHPIAELFKKHKFKDEYVAGISSTYINAMRESLNSKNIVVHFAGSMPNVIANIELLESLIEGNIEDSIATRSVTYKNANLIRMCDAIDFALSYGVTLVNFIALRETNAANKLIDGANQAEDLPQPVVDNIQNNLTAFIKVMDIFSRSVTDVKKTLEEIPEVLVEENNYAQLAKAMGKSKVDPMNLENIKFFNGNPFMSIGKWRAERSNAKYRIAQETLQQLKLRKMQLEKALEGKQDALLERQIRAAQSRIDELTRKLEEMDNA